MSWIKSTSLDNKRFCYFVFFLLDCDLLYRSHRCFFLERSHRCFLQRQTNIFNSKSIIFIVNLKHLPTLTVILRFLGYYHMKSLVILICLKQCKDRKMTTNSSAKNPKQCDQRVNCKMMPFQTIVTNLHVKNSRKDER